MRRITNIFIVAIFALLTSCTSTKIIPDLELAEIFRDAYVVNAYTNVKNVSMDSLLIYEPIFKKYGYTVDDVKFTIGNFSKRKSARLGDIVERSIKMLEAEGEVFDREVAILDTIDAISTRRLRRVILQDSLMTLRRLSDTTKFQLVLDDIQPGNYAIKFNYLIDSLDRNVGSYRSQYWFERDGEFKKIKSDTTENGEKRERELEHFHSATAYISRGGVKSFARTMGADTTYSRMVINMVDLLDKKNRPGVVIRDLEIVYTPTPKFSGAIMFDSLVIIKLFSDELLPLASSQDSL